MHGRSPISELSAHIDKLRAELEIEKIARSRSEEKIAELEEKVKQLEKVTLPITPVN